jgi:diguanylate cyclase (GGDEF)-like protein
MKKEELKSLAKDMYENLIVTIDEQDEATVQQLINYLNTAAEAMSNIEDDDITTLEYAKSTFYNAYKEIAKQGLLNYKTTNSNFLEISNAHTKVLSACDEQQINIPEVTNQFKSIQKHMIAEIEKANTIISSLSNQVKTLEKKSNIDSLTKVFNRRALSTYLDTICEEATSKYNIHMLMLDLDDFKKINDTYGHVAGDKILIFISNILKQTLRDADKIFRYGGEEFIIVLNRIDKKRCKQIASRILELISANKLIYKGETISVTASIGSSLLTEGDTPDSFIARADKALYIAKENGKNQIYTMMD